MVSAVATSAAPVDTDPLRSLVSPLGGLVGQVGRLPAQPGEPAIPVSLATLGDLSQVLPQVRRATGGASTRHELDGAGGALDPARAELVSVAEALERYASCVYDPAQFIRASADDLGDDALDLDSVPRCSATELAHPRCPVVAPDRTAPIRWVRGVSLTRRRTVWVPAMLTYLHIAAESNAERFTQPISTGCAAHRTPEAAVLNGLCEVVERDAISLTWLQRLRLPRLDVDEVDAELAGYLDLVADRDHEIHLFDATTDAGVPTVYGLDLARHHPTCTTVVMCATDLDPRRAVMKVLREAASARIALVADRPDPSGVDDFGTAYDGARHMGRPEHLPAFDFLLGSTARRPLSAVSRPATGDTAADLRYVLDRMDRLGAEVVAVDLSTDEARRVGMHVVRVLVPALQPLSFSHRARYLDHPRLYAAPAALGHPVHTEADLNPWPQPFA
jgi:ribosomal protein S12 methylthiotransferase accessory factor